MRLESVEPEIPTYAVLVVLVLFAASMLYGIVVMRSLLAPLAAWLGLLGIALSLFVVYLLYRFVVAVEQIARKL